MTWRSQQTNVTEFIGPIPRVVGCVFTPTTPRRLSGTALAESKSGHRQPARVPGWTRPSVVAGMERGYRRPGESCRPTLMREKKS